MAVYSVARVNRYLRDLLSQDALLQDLWVEGEVSNLARPASGNTYFTLKDSNAALHCVIFRDGFTVGAELLSNGIAVIAHGRLSLYEARGDVQLYADIVRPEGVGELQLRLEELKLKLRKEGLFDPSRKRPLPEFPRRVAVITSPSAAVWQDIRTVVDRRYPLTELLLVPAPVQGAEATPGILEAFAAVERLKDVDAVIVARGGGSLEDLWAFNEEPVARAVFACGVPVVSAIGHETDVTIADMVADHRAPTPSAAAEMAVPDRIQLLARLATTQQALTNNLSGRVRSARDAIRRLRPRIERSQPDLAGSRLRIDELLGTLATRLGREVDARSERTRNLALRLESLSPKDILRRGYAIVQTDRAEVLTNSAKVGLGASVQVTLAKGGFGAEVTSTDASGPSLAEALDNAPARIAAPP